MPFPSFFDSVASVLHGLARRHGMEAKLLEHKLLTRWPEIVGEPLAHHTRPDQIRFKKLYLVVDNSVWLQHLTFLKPELLAKIHKAAGSSLITDVVLRVGPVSRLETDSRRSGLGVKSESTLHELQTPKVEPSPSLKAEAEAHAAAIRDPELRSQLAEVMALALAQQEDRSKR